MRTIDETGLKLCKIQADIFAESIYKAECSSLIFLRRFMNSSVAKRMDEGGFLFEACDINEIFAQINSEFGESSYGKEKYSVEELYWIGYIYRYWCYTYNKTSKQIYNTVKPKELRDLYYPYHSLDPAQAIDRILEAKGLREDDLVKKGVQVFRKLLNRE